MYDEERYDEERSFSWTGLFIKVIIALIIILFIVWIISLVNRKKTITYIEKMTDVVFTENISTMRNAGKEYFTADILPAKDGDIYKITLEEMYNKRLLSTLKDKNGIACSAQNSYVSVEKIDDEYEIKTYLECGDVNDSISTFVICNQNCVGECPIVESDEGIEYQYSKTIGSAFSDWGSFSNWSTQSVAKSDTTDVETKVVKENYSYDKTITEDKYMGNATCAAISGYSLVSNVNGICTYSKKVTSTSNPVCPSVSGYTYVSRDGFTCSYSKTTTEGKKPVCPYIEGYNFVSRDGFTCNYNKTTSESKNPVCPSVSGYTYVSRDGFTCSYSKTTSNSKNPTCPSVSGYTYVSRDGFTCNYSKTTSDSKNPTCPSVSGYTYTGINGFTCNYSRTVTSSTEYTLSYYSTGSGSYVPKDTATYHYVQKSADYVYNCDGTCGMKWYYTYTIYKKVYKTTTETTTKTATCPSGYSRSGNTCVKNTTSTTTKTASCPSGYSKSGNTCVKTSTSNMTKTANCPTGYSRSGNTCVKNTTSTTTKTASCPSGYSKSGNTCSKTTTSTTTKNANCPSGQTNNKGKCYKKVTSTVTETGVKDITYYRYRTRNYIDGSIDYKWSTSKDDKSLLNAGYKLTGKTRNIEMRGK